MANSSLRILIATGAQTGQISLQKSSEIGTETVFHLNFVFCFVASCSDPGYIDRGNRSGRDFSHGKVVIYECTNQTYSLVGNPRLTCLDGKWDSARQVAKVSTILDNSMYLAIFVIAEDNYEFLILCTTPLLP